LESVNFQHKFRDDLARPITKDVREDVEAGLESVSDYPKETANPDASGAQSGALGSGSSTQVAQPILPIDADLARLVARWPFLAVTVRAAIMALLEGCCGHE